MRLFVVVMQRLLHFHYDVGRQDVEIYPCMKFFHSVFLCQLHAHTYAINNVLAETAVFNYDDVRHVTELHLSTKFHVCQCCG